MTADEVHDYIERVAIAFGPDRDLDQDIYCDIGLAEHDRDGNMLAYRAPAYTSDVNLSLSLLRYVFPSSDVVIHWPAESGAAVELNLPEYSVDEIWAVGKTPALAVLAALFQAVLAVGGERLQNSN